jgi:hypothetical protein
MEKQLGEILKKSQRIWLKIQYFLILVRSFLSLKLKEFRELVLKVLGVGILVHVDDEVYNLNYYSEGKVWTLCLENKGIPTSFISVLDENGANVTEKVRKYMGPFRKFPITTTPSMLGYDSLTFTVLKKGAPETIKFGYFDPITV